MPAKRARTALSGAEGRKILALIARGREYAASVGDTDLKDTFVLGFVEGSAKGAVEAARKAARRG